MKRLIALGFFLGFSLVSHATVPLVENHALEISFDHEEESPEDDYSFSRHGDIHEVQNGFVYHIVQSFNSGVKQTQKLVSLAVKTSEKYNLDPLLILAIIAKESSFRHYDKNGKPLRSPVGAEGAMQVWWKWHPEKAAKIKDTSTPEANIKTGTKILSDYINNNDGDVEMALRAYNGAVKQPASGNRYVNGVMTFYRQFEDVYSSLKQKISN